MAAPGGLLKHYSPRARVILLRGSAQAVQEAAAYIIAPCRPRGLRIGVLATAEDQPAFADLPVDLAVLGPAANLEAIGQALFAELRALDVHGVHLILVREPPVAGLGLAIGDRLFRAAEGYVLDAASEADVQRLLETFDSMQNWRWPFLRRSYLRA